ncbi:MaoC family dehydratase [Jiangella asiatica]|uniref:MaoC family dehydratase n=1 Tax=Jiangella asiatica TaxID=2530372 RepID=A0A4V2Z389_9ACTN|nr:MaoC family dehydratase [Jiangella asiatica]TDE11818.1 MaoC family dehydratase [Jiangella asiatica]
MSVKYGWVGNFFEDFEVGDVHKHPVGRTVTEAENIWFTLLTCNTNMNHINIEYSKKTEFGTYLFNSGLTLAIINGLTVADISENAVANLGFDEVRLPAPVFVGDTLFAESTIIGKRPSKSRPYAGIVEVSTRGYKQDDTTVITYRRAAMIYTREGSPRFKPAADGAPVPGAPTPGR